MSVKVDHVAGIMYGKIPCGNVEAQIMATLEKAKRNQRLEARITLELKERLEYAATIKGLSLTGFVVSTAEQAAKDTIEQENVIRLTMEEQKRFVEIMTNSPEPNEALKRAFELHKKLISSDKV